MVSVPQAKILTRQGLLKPRYNLPRSLVEAVGMLKGKKRVNPLRYQRQLRREWEKRLTKLYRSYP